MEKRMQPFGGCIAQSSIEASVSQSDTDGRHSEKVLSLLRMLYRCAIWQSNDTLCSFELIFLCYKKFGRYKDICERV